MAVYQRWFKLVPQTGKIHGRVLCWHFAVTSCCGFLGIATAHSETEMICFISYVVAKGQRVLYRFWFSDTCYEIEFLGRCK